MNREEALQYAQLHHDHVLAQLIEFLRIPSVSAQPQHDADTARAAEWLADTMHQIGLHHVAVMPTGGHPIVYGDWLLAGPDRPTVLFYGHYDVQPPDPLALWDTPPFEPHIADDYLWARGASDDKGQVMIILAALASYLQAGVPLPINVKVMLEGEEESGSTHLAPFIEANRQLLHADVAYIADTAMAAKDRPSIIYGLRGIVAINININGPVRDLHSGVYGGVINNPINALAHILAQLKDEQGHILIPHFYDKVRPISADERARLAQSRPNLAEFIAYAGASAEWGEPEYSLPERMGARPTLEINGIVGGYTGIGSKTIIPTTAHAKITMRLVPDQTHDETSALFEQFVRQLCPPSVTVTFEHRGGGNPSLTNYDHPAVQAAAQACQTIFSVEPIFAREGASIPVVEELQRRLGLETVLLGFALEDDNIHSPNERFYLPNLQRGVNTIITFLANYGGEP